MRKWTSPSQVSTWLKCEIDWYFQKVVHKPYTVTWRATAGTAMGEAANRSLAEVMTTGTHLSMEALEEVTREAFRKEWKTKPPTLRSHDPTEEAAENLAVAAAQCWVENLAGKIQAPAAVEPRIELQLDFVDVDLLMYPDLYHVAPSGLVHTADWKFKGQKVSEDEAKYSLQLAAYWWAVKEPNLILNARSLPASLQSGQAGKVALGCVVGTKTKLYEQWLEETCHEGHVHQLKRTIHVMEDRIASGVFKPADPLYGYVCGPSCAHWDYCPHGSRDVTLHHMKTGGQP